jgi:arginyl-tRNA synthetase
MADTLGRAAAALHEDERLGVPAADSPQRIIVDYCGANVAKPMHVGHLRSLIIGDCFARVFAFLGHEVLRRNHIGDWGLQMGMIAHAIAEAGLNPADLTLDRLETLYRDVNRHKEADPIFARQLADETRKLQGTPKTDLAGWQKARQLTLDDVHHAFRRLGVLLVESDVQGESAYSDDFAPMVADLTARGLAVDTEGAIGVFTPELARRSKGKDGQDRVEEPPPFRVVSRDGTYQYATFDLAAIRHRVQHLRAQRVVYTHDSRQAEHFAQLFAVAHKVGYAPPEVVLEFAPFGTVLGEDNRPLKTRTGENVKLSALLDEAEARALTVVQDKNPDLTPVQQTAVAHAVAIGAIKYADLSSERVRDYVFSWDRMLALKGNTAPYLQYAYARIQSIFRKGGAPAPAARLEQPLTLTTPEERGLVIRLAQFADAVTAVAERLEPHRLCTYLYELATQFSAFYEACPVLKAEDARVRADRLRLANLTARTLAQGLGLLGITVLGEM